jgi:tRNA pseudouridine synthase 10
VSCVGAFFCRGVEVLQLHDVSKDKLASIKEGEQHKEKTYEALCWISRPLTDADVTTLESIGEIELQQGTPVRVLHRRAPLTRAKVSTRARCWLDAE